VTEASPVGEHDRLKAVNKTIRSFVYRGVVGTEKGLRENTQRPGDNWLERRSGQAELTKRAKGAMGNPTGT